MSVGGLAKIKQPNARKASSLRKMASSNTATATRSTTYSSTARSGSVFNSNGVLAQRTITGTRAHTNPKVYNSYTGSLSNLRHALIDNRPGMPSIEVPQHTHKSGKSDNAFAIAMMSIAALSKAAAPMISDLITAKSSASKMTDLKDNSFNYDTSGFKMTNDLKAAGSFDKINNIEDNANKKAASFKDDYNKSGADSKNHIQSSLDNINKTLEGTDANVTLDLSKLDLSTLEFNPDDLSSFDKAAETIDKDTAKAEQFKSKDLADATKALNGKAGKIRENIGSLETSLVDAKCRLATASDEQKSAIEEEINNINKQIEEAKANLKKINDAEAQLKNTVSAQVDDLINDLKAKQTELGDIKQVKSDLADKKYDLAKSQDEAIKKNNDKMQKLAKQIKNPKTQNKETLIKEYNSYAKNNQELKASLDAAGTTEFKNSKNTTYKVVNADKADTTELSDESSSKAEGKEAGGNKLNAKLEMGQKITNAIKDTINQLKNSEVGSEITIQGQTYKKTSDTEYQLNGQIMKFDEIDKLLNS